MANVVKTVLVPFSSREGRPVNETDDCAVQALATAANVPYAFAHKAMAAQCGRQIGKGTSVYLMNRYMDGPGAKCRARVTRLPYGKGADKTGITLRSFCRKHNRGRFVVCVRGHALAVVDGEIIDGWEGSDLRRVVDAWRVKPGRPRRRGRR